MLLKGQTEIWNLKSTNRIYSKILLKHLMYYKMQLDSLINKMVQITENKCFVPQPWFFMELKKKRGGIYNILQDFS